MSGAAAASPWSYSRITTFAHCPLAYKLQYIDKLPQTNNAFAEFGLLCHRLLEQYATGELDVFDLAVAYQERYDKEVTHRFPPFPKGLAHKYHMNGLDFFSSFTGFGSEYDIVSVEDRFNMEIGNHPFTGVVDLLLRETDTGKLILTDHKSKALTAAKREIHTLNKQLYLYAAHVKHVHGQFPDMLRFHLFRERAVLDTPFDIQQYTHALQWASDLIVSIHDAAEYPSCTSDYFCRFLCSVSEHCPQAQEMEQAMRAKYRKAGAT